MWPGRGGHIARGSVTAERPVCVGQTVGRGRFSAPPISAKQPDLGTEYEIILNHVRCPFFTPSFSSSPPPSITSPSGEQSIDCPWYHLYATTRHSDFRFARSSGT